MSVVYHGEKIWNNNDPTTTAKKTNPICIEPDL